MDSNVTTFWNFSAFINPTIIFNASSEARSLVILIASWFAVPVFCAGALLNAAVLLTFVVHANQLINSFSIHIVNLTVLDLAYCLVLSPLMLYRNFDESWLHSPANCGFYKYASWTISNLLVWQHLVVCVDRWLAFIVPMWYREKKTVKMGVLAFLGVCLFYHIWYLPLLVQDLRSERNVNAICFRTKRTAYTVIFTVLFTVLPQLCIYLLTPLLMFFTWRRRRNRNRVHLETSTHRRNDFADRSNGEAETHNHSGIVNPTSNRSRGSKAPSLRLTNASAKQDPPTSAQRALSVRRVRRRPALSRNAQLVFLVTLVQIMTALPETVFSLMLSQRVFNRYAENGLLLSYLAGSLLFVLDPVLYIVFLPTLRTKLLRLFQWK